MWDIFLCMAIYNLFWKYNYLGTCKNRYVPISNFPSILFCGLIQITVVHWRMAGIIFALWLFTTPDESNDELQMAFMDEGSSKAIIHRWYNGAICGWLLLEDEKSGHPLTAVTEENVLAIGELRIERFCTSCRLD